MNNFARYFILSLLFLAMGCKSTKTLTTQAPIDEKMTAKQIIRENNRQKAKFKTLQAKVRVDYTEGSRSNGASVNLRMEKDKVIWMSAPFGVIRLMITPDHVKFYDKLNNQYFDGDYSLLTDLLGTEIDFEKVQDILLGEAMYDLRNGSYNVVLHETSYFLSPEHQQALFEIFYLVNPGYFKLDSQQLFQPQEKRMLQIDYQKYQQVGKEIFPENIRIIAVEDNDEITIDLDFKGITLDQEVRFPFTIPSGYKEIQL